MAAFLNQFYVDYRLSIVADLRQTSTHILQWKLIVKSRIFQFKLYTDPKYRLKKIINFTKLSNYMENTCIFRVKYLKWAYVWAGKKLESIRIHFSLQITESERILL